MSGSSPTNTTTTTSGPPAQVLQQYQDITGLANQVAQTPLEQYQGPMVQGFSPMQQQSFQGIQDEQGIANPYINSASQYASSAATPIAPSGSLSADQLSGLANQGISYSNAGANTNVGAAGAPGIGEANAGVSGINNALSLGSTANYGTNVGTYMSPYTQDVVNSTQQEFNNQNAQQNQGIIGNAISSGAWGGDRAGVAQGIAAGQEALAQAPVIAGLENTGYSNAQGELNTQQSLGLQGNTSAGTLGTTTAGLGQSAAATQAQLQQAAGAQQLGLYNTEQQTGVGAQEATGWLGSNAANTLGALGQQAQSSALTDASALYSAGTQQQSLGQEELNIPYEEFEAQQAYPFQTSQWLSNISEGIGGASGGTGSTTSPGASTGSQVLGGALGTAGILGATGAFGSNGYLTGLGDAASAAGPTAADVAANTDAFGNILYAATGGRIPHRSLGGRMARPGFLAGGVPILNGGIEDPSVNLIPSNSSGSLGTANSWIHQPNVSQVQSSNAGDGGLLGLLGPIATIAKFASLASGGRIPRGFAGGGSPTSTFTPDNGSTTGVTGYTLGSRGIAIPQLGTPSTTQQVANVPANLNSNYSPPPVSSLPYTATTFPSLTSAGGSGQPTTVSVNPVQSANGTFAAPAPPASAAPPPPPPPPPPGGTFNSAGDNIITLPSGGTVDLTQVLSTIPGGLNGMNNFARGGSARGPAGFRSHYDGGGLVGEAGATSAGLPVSGGNPLAQGAFQNIAQLPPEKLQELAARLPPNSPQGALVRTALQRAHANPQAATAASQPAPQPTAQPQQPVPAANGNAPQSMPMQQPLMARGGRMRFDDGGSAGESWGTLAPEPQTNALQDIYDAMPDSLATRARARDSFVPSSIDVDTGTNLPINPGRQPASLGSPSHAPSIFDLAGGQSNEAARGIGPTVANAPAGFSGPAAASSSSPKAGPVGFRPSGTPVLDAVSSDAPSIEAPANIDFSGKTSGTDAQGNWMQSPWMALAAAGAGMMAGRSPQAGVNIGEGLESGLKFASQQESEADKQTAQKAETQWRNKDVDLRAQQLSQAMEEYKGHLAVDSGRLSVEQQKAADEAKFQNAQVGIQGSDAAARTAEANRGYFEPAHNLMNKDGTPQVDANGNPLAVYINRYNASDTRVGPAIDPGFAGTKMTGQTDEIMKQLLASGAAKDPQTALAMVHDPSGHFAAQISQAKANLAGTAARNDPMWQADPTGATNKWNGFYGVAAPGATAPAAAAVPTKAPPGQAPASARAPAASSPIDQARAAIAAGAPRAAVMDRLTQAGIDPSGL